MKTDRSRTVADAEYEKQTDASAGTPIRKGDYLPGDYRVETDAIRGGMGSVWRIYHTEYGVNMALKRPRQKYFTSPEQKLDFIRECDTWLNLGIHPNIVTCFRVAELYGVPSIFSEWMDFSLKNIMTDGRLYEGLSEELEKRLLDIAIQSAEGLSYAHAHRDKNGASAGLIHQDVKPGNLLLTKSWDVRVADFGLSRAYAVLATTGGMNHDRASVSHAGRLNGDSTILSPAGGYTLAYCSPEQMDDRPLTRRTDIYSWAVSMMEMYIGARSWETGVVAGLRCGEYMKHTRVRLAPRLKDLLTQCMKKDTAERPRDFDWIIDELRKLYKEEFSEPYFRSRPVIARSGKRKAELSSRTIHKAMEVAPGLILGGMDEPWTIQDLKPDVLVPLDGLPSSFWESGYQGELVYYREAIRVSDLLYNTAYENRNPADYPVADYTEFPALMLEGMVASVLKPLREGKRVAIFCTDGLTKAPYIAACVLFQQGTEKPIEYLRERYSPLSVTSWEQEKAVESFRVRHIAETYWNCKPLIKKVRLKRNAMEIVDDPDIQRTLERIRAELGERARILVRPWGVVPEISVLVEAPDEEQCERAMAAYIAALKEKGLF